MKYLVGIDPSFQRMGVAVLELETKKLTLNSGEFEDMVKWINTNYKMKDCGFVVENPALDPNIYYQRKMIEESIKDYVRHQLYMLKDKGGQAPVAKSFDDVWAVIGTALMVARAVGENSAAAKMFLRLIKKGKGMYIEISPKSRQRMDTMQKKIGGNAKIDVRFLTMPTKLNQAQFEEYCGFKGSSNEHQRDAATLITGRGVTWFNQLYTEMLAKEKKVPTSYPKSTNGKEFLINHKLHEKRDPF